MTKILFVCHGNICRSPMAEFAMKDLVAKNGKASEFEIASAATSSEEIGSPVHHGTRRILTAHGINYAGKTARRLTKKDYEYYDYLIGMDNENIYYMQKICGGDPSKKIFRLLDFTDKPGEVADPWYTGNFQATWDDVSAGCAALLKNLSK